MSTFVSSLLTNKALFSRTGFANVMRTAEDVDYVCVTVLKLLSMSAEDPCDFDKSRYVSDTVAYDKMDSSSANAQPISRKSSKAGGFINKEHIFIY